jgi:hypothetical protein
MLKYCRMNRQLGCSVSNRVEASRYRQNKLKSFDTIVSYIPGGKKFRYLGEPGFWETVRA